MYNLPRKLSYRIHKWGSRLARYIQLQLFITLFSWPLLLSWGLPLSLASIVGNLLFTPFLMGFLLLSSILFFCAVFSIPSHPISYALEWLSMSWITLLQLSDRSWLIGFAKPPTWIALLFPCIACLIMLLKKFFPPLNSILALLITLTLGACGLYSYRSYNELLTVPCFEGELITLVSEGKTALIDQGHIGRRVSAPSFVSHTLVPSLIKRGITTIEVIIITRPSSTVFKALKTFVELMQIQHIYLPSWNGALKNQGWQAWEQLITSARHYHTEIHLIDSQLIITVGSREIMLKCEPKSRKQNGLFYKKILAAIDLE